MNQETNNLTVKDRLEALKNKFKAQNLPKHTCYVPTIEKERAKQLGVRWNIASTQYEFSCATDILEQHPASRYLTTNYIQITGQIPFDIRDDLKAFGVVTTQVDGKWSSLVMNDSEYVDLIELLEEQGLL